MGGATKMGPKCKQTYPKGQRVSRVRCEVGLFQPKQFDAHKTSHRALRCTRTCTIPHICGTIGLRQTRYAKWCLPVFACLTSCPRVLLVFFCAGVLAPRAENATESIHAPPSFLLRRRFKVQTVCIRSNSVSFWLYVTRVHTLNIQPHARVLVV